MPTLVRFRYRNSHGQTCTTCRMTYDSPWVYKMAVHLLTRYGYQVVLIPA